jgi:isoquinoline 1-oxidoreductase beta subunit
MSNRHMRRAPLSDPARRQLLRLTTLAGAGLTLGWLLPGCGGPRDPTATLAVPAAVPLLKISPDGTVTVVAKHLEAGQGVWTGLASIIAEELDASWEQMRVEPAPALVPAYANLVFDPRGRLQGTGRSTSIKSSWNPMRQAGATARLMLVAAAARLWGVSAAEITVVAGQVKHEGSGNVASFGELAARAVGEEIPSYVRVKDPGSYHIIGRAALPRLDCKPKCTGAQQYAIDMMLPGMMTAMVLRPPRFGAVLTSFDASQAQRVPGVVDVVKIPRGIAVVGSDTYAARKGRDALHAVWDESRAEKRGSTDLLRLYRALAGQGDAAIAARTGSADVALSRAARVVDAEFEFPYLAHAAMEPLAAVARLTPGQACEIWAGSQLQTVDQKNVAAAVGLQPSKVTIHTMAAGGSFGRRASPDSDYLVEAAAIARAVDGRYPVKVIWTREDELTGGRYRPLNYHRVTAGVDESGRLTAYRQRVVGQSLFAGTAFAAQMHDGLDPAAVEGHAAEQYDIENVDITWTSPQVGVPVQWWQSVGHSHMAFSKEVVIDELAQLTGQDPVSFRLKLLARRPRQAAVLKLAAAKADWDTPLRARGRGRGIALHESFGTVVAQVAEVTVEGGRIIVDRVVCAVDCGLQVNPDVIHAQMHRGIGIGLAAALHGRITLTDGKVDQSNFHQYPLLRLPEMPREIEVHVLPARSPPTGVGEPGTPPIAAAVANAVRAATGIKIRRLPIELVAAAPPPPPVAPAAKPGTKPGRPAGKPGGRRKA